MSTTEMESSSGSYPKQLKIHFTKMQMSTLINYAKAFDLPTTENMSHMEIACLVANHFVNSRVDENTVIKEFYDKTEHIKNNPSSTQNDTTAYPVPKRQSKKPRKYTQTEEVSNHYNTRSKQVEVHEKEVKEVETKEETLYCFCGKPENGDDMIQCESADCKHKWFHYSCVGIDGDKELPEHWYCPECSQKINQE